MPLGQLLCYSPTSLFGATANRFLYEKSTIGKCLRHLKFEVKSRDVRSSDMWRGTYDGKSLKHERSSISQTDA
ncbi:hypothetical protein PHLCEN_2v12052 [Hermanssonia centrifuga]|uniref:Uncharacterized protein n=1 Tax=Hermanssonia centrifuga TaxID=98765 RepID=A0A2R6NIE5_9APHY|nr:hypothetical protein PHLCEN_2v12052 [Hermanssonia centrifuga]